jgi:hypothetical protein
MSSKWSSRIFAFGAAALMALYAQEMPLDQSSIKVNLPSDAPISLVSANMGESRAVSRGSALVLDLHMTLTFRNTTASTIRGVTLLVLAQEVTGGGKGQVTLPPPLNVEPGQSFQMAVETQLMRPGRPNGGPLVQVDLDGVLFKDLHFYGKNRLDSKRSLTAYEMEAQRDRQYFKQVLAARGPTGLQQEILAGLVREAARPRINVAVRRNSGPAVSSAVVSSREHVATFAFLKFPDSPVEPIRGSAQIADNEARTPNIEIRNNSHKPVRYVEIGWIVRDPRGGEFMAASVPASGPSELYLPPGHSARVLQDSALRFTRNAGEPVAIAGMTAFVSQVEFENGSIWVPNRASLSNAQLLHVLAPSTTEQWFTHLYNSQGLKGLVEELNKY